MMRIASLLLAGMFAATAALADGHDGVHARVDVLPGWRADDGTHIAALRVRLEPGWKTYWRAPGAAGLPPAFDWSASRNVAAVRVHWPVPEVFLSSGITTLGYHDEVILPLEIEPETAGADISLSGALAMGICENICVPVQETVEAALPAGADQPDPRITSAMARRPETEEEAGLAAAHCALEAIKDGLRVTARLDLPALGGEELAVFETDDPAIWVSEATSDREGLALTAVADLVPPTAQPFEFDPQRLRITVISGARAVDIRGCDPAP